MTPSAYAPYSLLVLRLLPPDVAHSARQQAQADADRPTSRSAAVIIVAIWLAALGCLGLRVWQWARA